MKNALKTIKKIDTAELTAAYIRVLQWFFSFPNQDWTFNEVCKATRTAKTTGRAIIDELEKRGIIKRAVFGRLWRLYANPDSEAFRNMKIVNNLDLIFGTNLVSYIKSLYPQARAIILFGSYRKGDDRRESDVDIAVEIPGVSKLRIEHIGTIDRLGYRENVPVNLHVFSQETVDANIFASIANGIVLYGFLEVKPRAQASA